MRRQAVNKWPLDPRGVKTSEHHEDEPRDQLGEVTFRASLFMSNSYINIFKVSCAFACMSRFMNLWLEDLMMVRNQQQPFKLWFMEQHLWKKLQIMEQTFTKMDPFFCFESFCSGWMGFACWIRLDLYVSRQQNLMKSLITNPRIYAADKLLCCMNHESNH